MSRSSQQLECGQASAITEGNPTTRRAMIAVLDEALKAKHADKQTELWRMKKGQREVTCVAVYTIVGLDLRLLEHDEMLRTELCRDAFCLEAEMRQWQRNLRQVGWS